MTDRIGVAKSSPNVSFWLEADYVGMNVAGNYTIYHLYLRAANSGGATTGSQFLNYGAQIAVVDGIGELFRHQGQPFLPGGYGSGQQRWRDGPYVLHIGHDANGYHGGFNLRMQLRYGNISEDHTFWWPGSAIPRVPKKANPPHSLKVRAGSVTPTNFTVDYTRGGTNGSNIYADQFQWSTTPNFSNVVWTDGNGTAGNGPSGASSPNGGATPGAPALIPGTTYYVRGRSAAYDVGWSDWSATLSQTTLPSVAPGMLIVPQISGTSVAITLSPPGGVSGVKNYTVERRRAGTTTPVTTLTTTNLANSVAGLEPGVSYEWRSRATIGEYNSPWTSWTTIVQPAPNTSAGAYFDGDSANKADTTYGWASNAGQSASTEWAVSPRGWRTFAAGSAVSGGAGVVMRASGGRLSPHAARVVFHRDTAAAGFIAGNDFVGAAKVEANTPYFASTHVQMYSQKKLLQAGVCWYTAAGVIIGYDWGEPFLAERGLDWQRRYVYAVSPANAAFAAPVVRDAPLPLAYPYGEGAYGSGAYGGQALVPWTPFLGGDWLLLDQNMVSLSSLFPYFDGGTQNTPEFEYIWLDEPNESASARIELPDAGFNPLADPDCAPLPQAPSPPIIESGCIDEVGTWRRYWMQIPSSEVSEWLDVLLTLTIETGAFAARQVRIRYYANPDELVPELFDPSEWQSEQILSYIPPHTQMVLDGPSQRVSASVEGRDPQSASHLLYGTGGTPATWPVLSCGMGYLISFDVPLDAPPGNETISVKLTQRQ